MASMLAFQDLPPPHPATTIALLALAVLLWFWARIQIIRRMLARGSHPGSLPRTPTWLVRLAVWRPVHLVLLALALVFGGLLWWSFAAAH